MSQITQSELDALAVAATATLLPLVRAAQTAGTWDGANLWYSKVTGAPYLFSAIGVGNQVNPQPDYSFIPEVSSNLVPNGAKYDGFGNCTVTIPQNGDYNYQQGDNDFDLHDPTPGPGTPDGVTYERSISNLYFMGATVLQLNGQPGEPVTSTVAISTGALLKEMNRIRGDLIGMLNGYNTDLHGVPKPFPGSDAIFKSPSAITSGPWVVGVNEPQTWNIQDIYYNSVGVLQGKLDGMVAVFNSQNVSGNNDFDNPVMCGFTNVEFWCTATDAVGLTMTSVYHFTPGFTDAMNGSLSGGTVTRSFVIRSGITASITIVFGVSSVSGLSVSGATATSTSPLTFTMNLTPGKNAVTFSYLSAGAGPIAVTIQDFTLTGSSQDDVSVVHPTKTAKRLKQPQYGATNECLFIGTNYVQPYNLFFTLSTTTIHGVWVAKTLPVPGINVYIDQDIPPFIGTTAKVENVNVDIIDIGVAGNGQMDGTADAPWASSMRRAAPVQIGLLDVTEIKGVNHTMPGITTRPAKWLVRRDTDFVPFDLGFNQTAVNGAGNYLYSINQGTVAPGQLLNIPIAVPPNVTAIKARLMQRGSVPGWQSGTFIYGKPVGVALDIYVQKDTAPTTTSFDFKKSDGTVTIGPDGGGGYMAAVAGRTLNFGVAATAAGAIFDLYVELDVLTPARIYTPQAGECFSYNLDSTPGIYASITAPSFDGDGPNRYKPIPQSGYCLFKVRATRLPVKNAAGIAITPATGTALTITLGQQIDNGDGTMTFTPFQQGGNLTISIPATGRDSDDVPIFIPVLAGNELAYQCASQVILEVWANWQPLWFNGMYSSGQFRDGTFPLGKLGPITTAFQYALAFFNNFDVRSPGWTPPYYSPDEDSPYNSAVGSAVVFPLFRALYDDTFAILVALGATPPGTTDAAGTGGSGSAGGGGSAGDPGAGGFGAL